jgi:hypothetical protein
MPSSAFRDRRVHSRAVVSLLAVLTSSTSACTIINDLNRDQCATDTDCHQRGGSFADKVCRNSVCVPEPTWGCLGKVNWPPPVGTGKVTAKLVLTDLLTAAPETEATARSCAKRDTLCDSPIASDFHSDADGILTVELEKHFDGFLEITAPGKISPVLYFFYPPVDEDRTVPFVPLVSFEAYATLAKQVNTGIDFERGAAIALSYDCQGITAPGIQFSVDEADDTTLPFFMEKGLPSITATETDSSGQGGFINVKPGIRRLSASLRESGAHIGTVSVVVRKPNITYTTMVPTPD